MRVIAFSGPKFAGKTWAARFLVRKYDALRLSFAQPLKRDLVKLGFDPEDVFENKPEHLRKLMQDYGRAWRAEDDWHWLYPMEDALATLRRDGYPLVVIDDLRFVNEAQCLRANWGAELIRIERHDPTALVPYDKDVSEHDLDKWDDWNCEITAATGGLDKVADQLDAYMTGGQING